MQNKTKQCSSHARKKDKSLSLNSKLPYLDLGDICTNIFNSGWTQKDERLLTKLNEVDINAGRYMYLVHDKSCLEYLRLISEQPEISETSEKIVNFRAVKDMVSKETLNLNNTDSVKVLHHSYDEGYHNDCWYRGLYISSLYYWKINLQITGTIILQVFFS